MKARTEEVMHEMSKPLARYAGDQDLEVHLREQERLGDPMLDYIRQKNKERNVKAGIPGLYIARLCLLIYIFL